MESRFVHCNNRVLILAGAVLIAVLSLALAPAAQAATIVNWGGNYVSSNQALQTGGFLNGQPLPLYPVSGYSTAGTSAIFHGHYVTTEEGTAQNLFQILNSSSNDRIEFKRDNNAWAGLAIWLKDGFLEAPGQPVSFNADNLVSIDLVTNAAISYRGIVIQIGNDYFISNDIGGGTGVKEISPTTLTWYNYDPVNAFTFTSANAVDANKVDLLEGGLINGITGIGFYAQRNSGTSTNAFRVQNFTVTAIPEPASLALLGIGGILIAGGRRRHRAGTVIAA
jgi:hypothetical protein